jgi:hypothetical protein
MGFAEKSSGAAGIAGGQKEENSLWSKERSKGTFPKTRIFGSRLVL